jgi:DNA-binding GntR family transcriptional regulator
MFTSKLVNSAPPGTPPSIADDLRRAILDGYEPPGTLIPIESVADFFDVSPIPVREALQFLTGEGLVDHVPHVGYSVAKLTFAEFRELYDVRQALEAAALRQAIRYATLADDDLVREAHEALGTALAAGDERAYHVGSRRFHRCLIAPARMQRLVYMYEGAWNITEPARPMARVKADRRELLHDDHDRLMEAFIARDAARLVEESNEHYEHLKRAIEAFGDDPDLFRPE